MRELLRQIKRYFGWTVAVQISMAVWLALFSASSAVADVHLIVNSSVPVDVVSQNTARRIFIKHFKRWPDGSRVSVFVFMDRHPTHITMTKKLLGLYPSKLRKQIERQVFTGTGQAPVEVQSLKEMLKRVSETPGGIGYSMEEIKHDRIKTLEVQ